jgi:diaminopimelate decarboxylase
MSDPTSARTRLRYVDPATFTPQFFWKKLAGKKSREVYCEEVPLTKIAKQYGTPAYVYSRQAIKSAYDELRSGLGSLPHLLCFAVKANGNLSILKLLAQLGSGFDIVSGGELEQLRRIGVRGDRIVFSGVGKSREEIREALRYRSGRTSAAGVLQFNVESVAELGILLEESSRGASRNRGLPGVSIRVNPDVKAGGHPHISTGLHEHKFGLGWREARALYLRHRHSKYIRWQGISAHIGSQIVALRPFRQALGRVAGYVRELREAGIALNYLDFGGGLGVRYVGGEPATRRAYARMIAQIVRPLGVSLLLEPGRSIIAPAGILLSRVLYTKENSAKRFVVIDAAMNDLIRPALYDAAHAITRVALSKEGSRPSRYRADVVGPVCETGDCFLREWPIGKVSPGDIVAIWAAGAYGMVQASNYNGRCRPAEILVEGNRTKVIRRRETQDDLLRTQVLL